MWPFKKKKQEEEVEKSEFAIRHNIRISTPNGYFPEDVDRIINKLEKENEVLSKDNSTMTRELADLEEKYDKIRDEYASLKMTVSLMQIPDTSGTQDEIMLERIASITGKRKNGPDNNILETTDDKPFIFSDLTTSKEAVVAPEVEEFNFNDFIASKKIATTRKSYDDLEILEISGGND